MSQRIRSIRATIAAAVLVAAFATIAVPAARAYGAAVARLVPLIGAVSGTTFEDRRRVAYGDCGGLGYGYVSEVLRAFPDDRSRPLVRWPDWSRRIELVLPGDRAEIDDRVLVGIGVGQAQLAERAIASAVRRGDAREGATVVTRWAFATSIDYDLLTALALDLDGPPAGGAEYDFTLIESDRSPTVLSRWRVMVPAGRTRFVHTLATPVRALSHGRGATPFVLEVRRPAAAPTPIRLVPIGINVDASEYVMVHRRGACFTAVRREALRSAGTDPSGPWARFLEALTRAG